VFAARVLSWLPVVFGVLMILTNGSVRSAYFGGVAGLVCMVVGLGLNVTGRKWMKRITCSFA
jgi:Flp pilus assembly protein TadB